MKTLAEFEAAWKDEPDFHKQIRDSFCTLVDADPMLKEHRDYIEQHGMGFGERAFHWMWKLLVEDLCESLWLYSGVVKFLEIGVHCGQVLSLVDALLGDRIHGVVGVSPLDGSGDVVSDYPKHDYEPDIVKLFEKFNGNKINRAPKLIRRKSQEPEAISEASLYAPYHLLYIDGNHDTLNVEADIMNYTPMLAVGGCLVMDDASCGLNMPMGEFIGHWTVAWAVDKLLPPKSALFELFHLLPQEFKHIGNVGHNRIWRKIA